MKKFNVNSHTWEVESERWRSPPMQTNDEPMKYESQSEALEYAIFYALESFNEYDLSYLEEYGETLKLSEITDDIIKYSITSPDGEIRNYEEHFEAYEIKV